MVLYPNKLPESERVCSGICRYADLFFLKSLEKYQDIFEIFVRMSFSFVQKEK